MAFSGSRNYTESYTAANIIERAMKRLGIMDAVEGVDSTEEADALVVLNLLVKELTAKGASVFLRKTGHLFLHNPGTVASYSFGTSGSGYFTQQYYVTTLASAVSATDTALTVTDDTNMSDTDVILVEQDDGTLHDTTISGAPSSNAVTLASGMVSAAAAGNIVYSWPTTDDVDDKPAEIVFAARRRTNTDNADTNAGYMEGIDSPIRIVGEEEYRTLSTKLQTGPPVSLSLRQAAVNPEIFVWPTGGTDKHHSLVLEYNTYFQDLDSTSDNLDITPEGVNALAWSLAYDLSFEHGIGVIDRRDLKREANERMEAFLDYIEDDSVTFSTDYRTYR